MTYTLVPLGDIAGGDISSGGLYISDATANNPVRIVGFGTDGSGETATIIDLDDEVLENLGRLPGKTHAQAAGANPAGYVVGRSGQSDSTIPIGSGVESGSDEDRGWIYDPNTQTFTEFGDFEGGNGWSTATAINRVNQVVGYASENEGFNIGPQAFLWAPVSQDEIQRIGFAGDPPTSGSFQLKFFNDSLASDAIAWNATAVQVQQALESLAFISPGDVIVTDVNDPEQPEARWEVHFTNNLSNTNLPLLQPFNASFDQGSVGVVTVQDGSLAGLIQLPVPGANRSIAEDINNAGVVVGARDVHILPNEQVEAFVWDPVRGMRPLLANLDTGDDGEYFSIANAINNLGLAVGDAAILAPVLDEDGNQVYENGEPVFAKVGKQWGVWDTNDASPEFEPLLPLIETLDGNPSGSHNNTALAVNNRALASIVGASKLDVDGIKATDDGEFNAWVFHTGRATLLNQLDPENPNSENYRALLLNDYLDASGDGWTLRYATGINDLGQIVGFGINPQGKQEAFLLLPVNTRPELSILEHKVASPGQPLTWTVTATDADGDTLRFVLGDDAPDGMTLNQLDNWTAEVTWTPDINSPSQVSFTVTVEDDGHTEIKDGEVVWTAHTRTGHVSVQKPLLFFEDFEDESLGPEWSTPFTTGDGSVVLQTGQSVGGADKSLLFHSTTENGVEDLSGAFITVDLSSAADADRVMLSFYQLEGTLGTLSEGEEFDAQADAHVTNNSRDGLAISVDGTVWYTLRDVQGQPLVREADGLWQLMEYDLTAELERINEQFQINLELTSNFRIKWSRFDNLSFPSEGYAIDDVSIYSEGNFIQPGMTPDVFHRIDTGDQEELYRVAFFGNVDANTPILVSVHGGGREVFGHTTGWQRYVSDPSNNVDGLIVVSPYYAVGGKFDDYGLLSWNNSNDTAADESLLKFIDNLATITGVGDASQLYLFGFSRGAHFVEAFAAARPDRVAAVVAAAGDRQTFPLEDVEFPYGIKPFSFFSAPPEVTLDASTYLSHRMMIWIGQDDVTEVTDQGDAANLQGLVRTERAVNMFRNMYEVAGLEGLTSADYEFELFVQQNRSHLDLFLEEDLDTFYEFLFRPELSPPLNSPLDVFPVIVSTPTSQDQQASLPTGLDTLPKNSELWVEIWVRTTGATGIAAGSVGVVFDTDLIDVVGLEHSSLFEESTTGTFSDLDARVFNFGGATLASGVGVGEYALLGRIQINSLRDDLESRRILMALQRGDVDFELEGGGTPRTDLQPFANLLLDSTNVAPQFDVIDPLTAGEETLFTYAVPGFDPDGDNLTFSLGTGVPAGMSIDPLTGVIEWTPPDDALMSPNPVVVEVIVTDDGIGDLGASTFIQITVENTAPTVNISGSVAGKAGDSLPFNFDAVDPAPEDQAGSFTYQIDWNNDGTFDQTINDDDSTSTSHTFATAGSHTIGVRAVDKDGGVGEVSKHVVHIFSLTTDGGNIVWNGSDGNDRVEFVQTSATEVTVNTVMVGGHTINASELLPVTGQVQAFGHNGNDRLDATQLTDTPVYFEGGFGNDTLVGSDMNDVLKGDFDGAAGDGAEGNDRIEGRGGNDSIFGDGAEGGADTIFGGEGDDIIRGDGGDGAEGRSDRLIGGGGNDQIFGHTGNDFIDGGGDNDLLVGGRDGSEGDDTIIGGAGNDILVGEKGNDRLEGTSGFNILLGGVGSDTLVAGTGADILVADETDYDQSPAGLAALRAEWASGGGYSTRIDNIRTGDGLTGGNTLDAGTSVIDDGAVDHLFGNNQIELNWYIYNLAFDQITGKHPTEEADDTDGT